MLKSHHAAHPSELPGWMFQQGTRKNSLEPSGSFQPVFGTPGCTPVATALVGRHPMVKLGEGLYGCAFRVQVCVNGWEPGKMGASRGWREALAAVVIH